VLGKAVNDNDNIVSLSDKLRANCATFDNPTSALVSKLINAINLWSAFAFHIPRR